MSFEVLLRPAQETEYKHLIAWNPNGAILKQWSPNFSFPFDADQWQAHLRAGAESTPPEKIFTAYDKETSEILGHGELGSIDSENRSGRIKRILVDPAKRSGKGIGTQIVGRLMELGFDLLKLHRIDLHVLETNIPARNLYRKLGFVEEGIFRECYYRQGIYLSTCRMSILENEYRRSRTATRI